MKTYTLKFNNVNSTSIQAKNLTEAQAEVIATMNDPQNDLVICEIETPSGALSIIRKDGSHHWNHNGYSFGMVSADHVQYYRSVQEAKKVLVEYPSGRKVYGIYDVALIGYITAEGFYNAGDVKPA